MSSTQTRLSKCVAYLQRKQLFECAKAVNKAAGQVHCHQRHVPVRNKFSPEMNARLVESLWAMNSDPHCDSRNIQHVRKLIEAWRDMNGMPARHYDLPAEKPVIAHDMDDEAYVAEYESGDEYEMDDYDAEYDDMEYDDEYEVEEYDYDEPETYQGADVVVNIGEDDYNAEEVDDSAVEDCILGMVDRGGYISYDAICDEMAECAEDEAQIMDALKELVRQGHFEVTSRDPYNGQIAMVLKIR